MRNAVRLPLEELQPYLFEMPADSSFRARAANRLQPHEPEILNVHHLFTNDHPIEIEVGFGKGLFLVTSGTSRPDANFLGVEIERKYTLYVANRLAKRKLHNVRVTNGDARLLLESLVPECSVQAVHVYFPDPWWKNKHRKRRLFTSEFARACFRVLRPGGELHVATDVADYFAVIEQLLAEQQCWQPLPPPALSEPRHDLDYLTNFERKYRAEGRAISRAVYGKKKERCQEGSGSTLFPKHLDHAGGAPDNNPTIVPHSQPKGTGGVAFFSDPRK